MRSPAASALLRHRIVVAEDDAVASDLIIRTLRDDGYLVSLDPEALLSSEVLAECHLLISSLRVAGVALTDPL